MADEITITYPYDDEIMRYDFSKHRYILKKGGVLQELDINLDEYLPDFGGNKSKRAELCLDEVSQDVYDYLYTDCANVPWREYELAKCPDLRDAIKEMLLRQVRYICTSGALRDFSGVNVAKGTFIDEKILDERAVSRPVRRLAENLGLKYIGDFGGTAPSYKDGEY